MHAVRAAVYPTVVGNFLLQQVLKSEKKIAFLTLPTADAAGIPWRESTNQILS